MRYANDLVSDEASFVDGPEKERQPLSYPQELSIREAFILLLVGIVLFLVAIIALLCGATPHQEVPQFDYDFA